MNFFIRYLALAAILWRHWGSFIDWILDRWYKQEDELIWLLWGLIVMVTGLIITIKVYD